MKMLRLCTLPIILFAFAVLGSAQASTQAPAEDLAGIRQAALDYIEGWYEGSPERMERSLHPELAKRIVITRDGRSRLDQMSALTLINGVRRGGGTKTPKEQQQKDITILDVYGNTASVKLVAASWIDYLHVAKYDGRWVIVNVLWELKPQPPAAKPRT
jgi:hypothetical protein